MKNRIFIMILVASLSIILLACSLNDIKVASAAPTYILNTGFESGNLNGWADYTGTLSINNKTVNSGKYSVQSVEVGNNDNLYNKSLGGSFPGPIDFREYVYLNSTSAPSTSGDYYEVGGFSAIGRADFGDGEICVFNVAGSLYWGVFYRDVSNIGGSFPGFAHVISDSNTTSTAHKVAIGWNCVELQHTTGTISANGKEQLFLNGVSILNVTASANNYDRTPYNAVIAGSQKIANSNDKWNYYIDDVAVSTSYIGPLNFQLTISASYGTVTPSNGAYAENSTVQITATAPTSNPAQERYVWLGWVGSGIGSYTGLNNPAVVTMGSNVTERAFWEHQYYLTVSSPNGTTTGTGWYDNGTSAYASVGPLTVAGSTGTQYVFASWGGDATGHTSPSNAIVMNGPKTATANWQTQYYLTVNSVHGTTGGTGWYNSSATAHASLTSLTVAGATGTQYVFASWSGNASGTTSPSNPIIMNGPRTATANWQTQYLLTFAQTGVGLDFYSNAMTINGASYNRTGLAVWANPGTVYTFSYTSPLVVTANGEQYVLTGVSGNSSASSLTVSQAATITGAYKTQYYLSSTSPYGSPLPANGWYDSGSSISAFVSSPVTGSNGYQYDSSGWTGSGSVPTTGTTSGVTFTINAASTIYWSWQTINTNPTPTPTPIHTSTPTPTPSPTASPTPKPTNTSPTPTPSHSNQASGIIVYIAGIIIAIVIVAIVAAVLIMRRRPKI